MGFFFMLGGSVLVFELFLEKILFEIEKYLFNLKYVFYDGMFKSYVGEDIIL